MTESANTNPADESSEQPSVVLERIYEAPVELVWKLWAEADHFKQWYGPGPMTVPEASMDVRVGGKRLVRMESPDGSMVMWFTGEYRVVEVNRLLVYTDCIADEDGNPLPPSAMGMPGDEPMVTEVTVELTDLDGKTRLVLTHAGVPADSPGAQGWASALDKLGALLK